MAAPRPFPAFLGGAAEELIRLWEAREPGILELGGASSSEGKKGKKGAGAPPAPAPTLALPNSPDALLRCLVDSGMHLHTDVAMSRVVRGRKGAREDALETSTAAGRVTQAGAVVVGPFVSANGIRRSSFSCTMPHHLFTDIVFVIYILSRARQAPG